MIEKDYSWKNYGDVSPVEHGGFFISPSLHDARGYDIVQLINLSDATGDEGWLVESATVDLDTDDWIDWDSVKESAGIADGDEYPDARMVQDAIWYYGIEQFGGSTETIRDVEDVLISLRDFGINTDKF